MIDTYESINAPMIELVWVSPLHEKGVPSWTSQICHQRSEILGTVNMM